MRARHLLLVALALAVLMFVGVGGSIASVFLPERPALTADQRTVLEHPAHHGLRINQLQCLHGLVPCLVVAPAAGTAPGARGRQLREQMQARGIPLPPYGQVLGTVVLLHGRNGRKEQLLRIAERFAAIGLRSVIPDLPGHGDSPLSQARFGTTRFERTLPARVLADVGQQLHWRPAPAFLWGYSMGGAVAVHAAAQGAPWRGLIVVSSFDRLDAVVDRHLNQHLGELTAIHAAWFSPVSACLGVPEVDRVQPARVAAALRLPTLVIHGDQDTLIDAAHGRSLFAAVGATDKQWITVPGAGHRNVFITDMPLFADMSAWMLARLTGAPSAGTGASRAD